MTETAESCLVDEGQRKPLDAIRSRFHTGSRGGGVRRGQVQDEKTTFLIPNSEEFFQIFSTREHKAFFSHEQEVPLKPVILSSGG